MGKEGCSISPEALEINIILKTSHVNPINPFNLAPIESN
jgi:hypothetical protein